MSYSIRCPTAAGCGGRIVEASMIKPTKAPGAAPPGLPAPPPKQKKKKGAGGAAPAAAAPAASSSKRAPPPPPTKKQLQQQARATAMAMRSTVAPGYESVAGSSQPSGGKQRNSSRFSFPPGRRPLELQARGSRGCRVHAMLLLLLPAAPHLPLHASVLPHFYLLPADVCRL